jgi:hypothetical protein
MQMGVVFLKATPEHFVEMQQFAIAMPTLYIGYHHRQRLVL